MKNKSNSASFISVIVIMLVGLAMTGCASIMGASGHMADSINYVRQHKGEGMRRTMAGSEAELMDTAVKGMAKANTYTIVQEPHAVFASATNVDLTYAFYFYPSRTDGQTDVEVLIASPWLKAEQMQKFQEQAFSTTLVNINRQLQEKGFDPNMKVEGALLPLSTAAFDGQMDTAKKLITKGADPDLAIYELKEIASRQLPYLNYPANRTSYDKANLAVEMLNGLKSRQTAAKTNVNTDIQEKTAVKSDVDELPAIKARPNKNAYAIVIGIENYRQKLPKADFATHDAETVAEYLTKVMGYPEENVITLLNDHASNVDFAKYFEKWLPNNVEKDSTVFIYYSGHGAPNTKTGDAFLVPYDGDPSFINETGYSLKRLYDALGKLQAKEIIVALDSCFSGAGGRSVIAKGSRPLVMSMDNLVIPSKIAVLSASSGDQTSSTYEDKGHGLFTYFLLKGIKGDDDTYKNGTLEVRELFDYIKPQVERIARKAYNNEQSPQMSAVKDNRKIFLMGNGK